jgi:hypothetical protein
MTAPDTLDLTLALETLNTLGMDDGDLGYAYWSRVRQLLEEAAEMQTQIDALSFELEATREQLRRARERKD